MENDKGSYVNITEDKMEAWLFLAKTKEDEPYTIEDVYALLKDNRVVSGIKESKIKAMVKKRVEEREICVAIGKLPVKSEEGYFEFLFPTAEAMAKPEIRADGTVNYATMSVVQQCKKGDIVGKYHSNDLGEPGFNVFGDDINPIKQKKEVKIRGEGFSPIGENPILYEASFDGKVSYENGRLEVKNLLTIQGNVSYITEKIEFWGDIYIDGDVESGVYIHAGKSLTITGIVEPIQMVVGGDIMLRRGIQGAGKAKIICKGNMYADFIEQTDIEIDGNLQANSILNSHIVSSGIVEATGRKGVIVGGYTHADKGIKATCLGNSSEITTQVHVGVEPKMYDEMKALSKKEHIIIEKLRSLVENLATYPKGAKLANMSRMLKEKIISQNQLKNEIVLELSEIKEEQESIKAQIEQNGKSTVKVSGKVNARTVVAINNSVRPILEDTSFAEYFHDQYGVQSKVVRL